MKLLTRTAIANGLAVACASMAAHAQDTALEEIVVTATKRSISARELPYNISAVSGTTAEQFRITDIANLGKIAPGVNVVDAGVRTGFRSSAINIRGLASDPSGYIWSPAKNDPTVSLYVNDTPLFANLQLMDIDRVEVLRGPQGTLYGSGSMGGNVRYVLMKPDTEALSGRIKADASLTESAGDPNGSVSGVLNVPLSPNLAVRLNGSYTEEKGFMDYTHLYARNTNGKIDPTAPPLLADPSDQVNSPAVFTSKDDADNSDALYLRAAALYRNDKVSALLTLVHQELSADTTPMYQGINDEDDTHSAALHLIPFDSETDMAALEMDFDLGFATLTSASSFSRIESEGLHAETEVYTRFSFYPAYYGSSPRPLVMDWSVRDQDSYTQELRLVSSGDNRVDWLAGAYWSRTEGETTVRQFYPGYDDYANACFAAGGALGGVPCGYGTLFGIYPDNGGVPIVKDLAYLSDFQDEFQELAGFGEITFHVTDTWEITAGGRVFDQEYDIAEQGGLMFVPDGVVSEEQSAKFSDSLFKLNTAWSFLENHRLYATWSEGFRRGGINALGPLATPQTGSFKPDQITNIELGLKGLFADRIEYTVAVFDIDWSDIQIRSSCSSLALLCTVTGGDATVKGLEAEVTAAVTESLRLIGGYTYTDATLDQAKGSLVGLAEDGARLPGSAKHAGNLAAVYTSELDGGLSLELTASLSYAGKRKTDVQSLEMETLPTYTVIDASASVSGKHWSVGLFARNLSNERSRISQLATFDGSGGWGPEAPAIARRPRTIGLTASYNF